MLLRSRAWESGGEIPLRFTGYGGGTSPPLTFSDPPEGTRSFALIVTDLDSRFRPLVHWVLYDIPGTVAGLSEGISKETPVLADGSCQGTGGLGERGYFAPRPPRGQHRYRFRLYALSGSVGLGPGLKAKELELAIQSRTLRTADLLGTCTRP
jgi:Raf kinase inhibitor-like YbhB/YbcL family protein